MPTAKHKWNEAREDNREDERFMSHAPIIFSLFGTKFHREYVSKTLNHSKGGMCLETAEALKPGTALYIRGGNTLANQCYDANWNYLRTSTLAEVRWCRELADKFGRYYCVGVKYY